MLINPSNLKSIPRDSTILATANISWLELLKKQELPSIEILNNLLMTAKVLQIYRDKVFKCPLIITSGYRSPEYNKSIGGAISSKHCKGLAIDFKPTEWSVKDSYNILDKIHSGGLEKTNGDWVHIDIRKETIRFDNHNVILKCNYSNIEHHKIFV